ncbi:hypothetical protein BC629DRAFT_1733764 [Irpex lacteus]|nr:hypothetical protein BC629DRAFT_1733764 [Irpex lacteus]
MSSRPSLPSRGSSDLQSLVLSYPPPTVHGSAAADLAMYFSLPLTGNQPGTPLANSHHHLKEQARQTGRLHGPHEAQRKRSTLAYYSRTSVCAGIASNFLRHLVQTPTTHKPSFAQLGTFQDPAQDRDTSSPRARLTERLLPLR